MTVKEFIEKEGIESNYSSYSFKFAGVFECWINKSGVVMEQYHEGECLLENIKTMDQFYQLKELLTGGKKQWTI